MISLFAGAHGVGKSSLLPLIQKERPEIYTTDGFSRPVREFVKSTETLTPVQEQVLLNQLTLWNYQNGINQKNYLSTRSIVDAIVYSEALFPAINTVILRDVLKHTSSRVDHFFYIPIEFELENDGVRYMDLEFQSDIDHRLRFLLADQKLIPESKIVVIKGTIEERINKLKLFL